MISKLNFRKIVVLISFACCAGINISAQQVMNLKDCMKYAVEHSTKVKLQQMEVEDARIARRDAILQAFTPQISAGTYAYSNFGRSVDPETNTYVSTTSFNNGYSISGGITLFNGFSAVNNIKIAKTALSMGIDNEQLFIDQISLATMEAYYNLLYLIKLESILISQVETTKEALKLGQKQYELGQKGYSDVVEIEAELAERKYQLIDTQNRYADALLTLKDLMFWPIDAPLEIETDIKEVKVEEIFATPLQKEEIVNNALAVNLEIAIAKGKMESAKFELNSAKWRFTPSISLNGGWSTSYYTYPGLQGYTTTPFASQFKNNGGEYIQLSLSFPIFDRLSTFSNLSRKKHSYSKATLEYEQKVRDIQAEVIRAVQDRDGACAAFFQADKRAVLQEEAYNLNIKKLEQGLISTIDFQKVSDNWLDAKTKRLDSLLKYYIKKSIVDYYNGIKYLDQEF